MTTAIGSNNVQTPSDASSQFNALSFVIDRALRRISTATLVKVTAVTNDGGLSPVGLVDLQPLVNLIDGANLMMPHGIVSACPYLRLQGGANAVILDPQVGDIGIALFADRDISSVIANKGQANPGSRRRFDMADGLYIGGVLNGTPTQWVRFSADGIELVSPAQVKLQAPDVQISCETFALAATTSASITTPTLTINGNTITNGDSTTTGTATVDGSALLNGALAVSGVANFSGGIFDGVTSVGVGHKHGHGTIASSGETDVVVP
jgi:hypothetical protein